VQGWPWKIIEEVKAFSYSRRVYGSYFFEKKYE
jgi:hypothetical protein